MNLDLILVIIYSYTFGSIPFGLIITKLFLKKDVRNIGSGNIGATNVLRTGNKSLAVLTLVLDILKGYFTIFITSIYFFDLIYFSALICFMAHIFPIWLKFKGGKGVATYLGIILGLSFNLALIFGSAWLVVLFFYKYSSLSSMTSSLLVFIYSIFLGNLSLSFYLFIVFIIVLYTHRENIIRLKNNSENKINF